MARSTGFSQKICLPAAAAARIRSACVSVYEQISTAPTALSANTSAVVTGFAPCSAASAAAASALGSITYLSRAPVSRARLPAWILPMRPAPKSAQSIMFFRLGGSGAGLRHPVRYSMLPEPRRPDGTQPAVPNFAPSDEEQHAFCRRPALRRHLPRPLRRRFLRPADRRATRRRRDLRQVPRRLVGEHRVRLRAPGSFRGDGGARRRRRDGALPHGNARARGVRRLACQHRPGAAHRGRGARHQGSRHVPADLLPRELRRHGGHRRRRRGGFPRAVEGAPHHRHPFLHAARAPGEHDGARARAQERRAHRARHRLPAGAVGTHQARRRRDPLHRERHGDRAPAGRSCRCSIS